jgi:preprotein translocase subunit SecA
MFDRDVEYIIQEGKIKIVDEQTGRVLDGRRETLRWIASSNLKQKKM